MYKKTYLLIISFCIVSSGQPGFADTKDGKKMSCNAIEVLCTGENPARCGRIGGYAYSDNGQKHAPEPWEACQKANEKCYKEHPLSVDAIKCMCLAGLAKLRDLNLCER